MRPVKCLSPPSTRAYPHSSDSQLDYTARLSLRCPLWFGCARRRQRHASCKLAARRSFWGCQWTYQRWRLQCKSDLDLEVDSRHLLINVTGFSSPLSPVMTAKSQVCYHKSLPCLQGHWGELWVKWDRGSFSLYIVGCTMLSRRGTGLGVRLSQIVDWRGTLGLRDWNDRSNAYISRIKLS